MGTLIIENDKSMYVVKSHTCPACGGSDVEITLVNTIPTAAMCNKCESQYHPLSYRMDNEEWVG